nr:NADH-quinone oxidoreductase subunit A [Blastopirellula retiformator]
MVHRGADSLLWTCLADIGIFFAILMVGFAYVWKRGDLDWVRAMTPEARAGPDEAVRTSASRSQAMTHSR